jgi:hypothetical protein
MLASWRYKEAGGQELRNREKLSFVSEGTPPA